MDPIFLIGAERSGTTLLRLMLDGHPKVSWLFEFTYAVDKIDSTDCWPDLDSYTEWLGKHRIFKDTGFAIDRSLDYPSLIQSFLTQKQEKDRKPIIGATCHRYYNRLLRIFPEAKFIHLLRDPRDVARSNIGMGWAGNVWFGVDNWIEAEKLWGEVKKGLSKEVFIDVKYEELIISPQKTLTSICHFLGLDYDALMMSYPENTTYSKPDLSLTEQWKRKLSSREIQLVEYKTRELMPSRGYKFFSENLKAPSFIEQLLLAIQSKYNVVRRRVSSYGVLLFTSHFVFRKLKIKGWESRVKLKMNDIDRKYLK